MKRTIRSLLVLCATALCAALVRADVVHVTYQTSADGTVETVAEATLETGCDYSTVTPPTKTGCVFTHWSSSASDPLTVRDAFGRALDSARFTLYQDVTLTANYLSASQDTDGDGIPDGYELYWYGNLDQDAASDTDGDGFTFAEELANGTNPLFPDTTAPGGVAFADSETLLYNPNDYAPFVVRSEPEGALFETATNYVTAGNVQRTAAMSVADGFAYWTVDGVEQRDAFGRALDQATVTPDSGRILDVVAHVIEDEATRQSRYWYGRDDVAMDSDTDGDGYTFAEELANGTNPLFPDTTAPGGVAWADGETLEANLQPFDQATGAVVGEAFEAVFTSPFAQNAATSATFGANARPVVTDVNGDGLFDLVVLYDGGYAVYVNGGTDGNPTFTRDDTVSTNGLDLAQGSLAALDGLTLDVTPTDAVSCAFGDVDQDGIVDLLVSDADGRIWFYKGQGENAFSLQHKVWAGSHAGFAKGLTVALVDWDGDGDLDCVCGTADGKLMLLVDPRTGRPTNVRATAGVDSVVLTWDPNGNSRVRGYGVYRGADTNAYDRIEPLWPLPRYRDVPETVQDYYYRVTSVSRFYTSGNSAPTTSESMPTDAVYVQFRPSVWLNDASGFTGSNVTVVVSMSNSMGISAEGLSLSFAYDPAVLAPLRIRTTGLTAGLAGGGTASMPSAGTWRFASQGGEIATGAGRFLLLDFKILEVHDVTETTVTLTDATVNALDGRTVALDLPQSATVEISDPRPLVPAGVSMNVSPVYADTLSTFKVPIPVMSTKALTNLSFTVGWDADVLELRGASDGAFLDGEPSRASAKVGARGTVPGTLYLTFYAKDQHDVTETVITLGGASAFCIDGLAAKITTVDGTVHLTDANASVPVEMMVATYHTRTTSGEAFQIPVGATTSGDLATLTVDVDWDSSLLSFVGCSAAASVTTLAENSRRIVFACEGNYNLFNLDFEAAPIAGLQTNAWTRIVAASGVGKNGLAAVLKTELPRTGNVIIVREVGRYDPGDVDGDGVYTDNDLLILTGYVSYLNVQKKGANFARTFANGYLAQYGVDVRLTGDAARAADLGIAPQFDVLSTAATATYATPTLEIVAFDPQTGRVRIKVTPGAGNAIRASLATGCVHVYGTSDLSQRMRYISDTAFDLTPYLKDATKGEADLTVALGSATFIKVKAETTIKQEGEEE